MLLIFLIVFLILYIYLFNKTNSNCKYTNDNQNYFYSLCSYQIEKYLVVYDLCYEKHPNFKCFISTIPAHFIFTTFYNQTYKSIKKSYCDEYYKCSYVESIKGIYPLPKFNRKRSLIKLRNTMNFYHSKNKHINIVIGSGISYNNNINKVSDEWICTDQDVLDITNRYDITQHLPTNYVENMIAMHVFEHISHYNVINALLNIKYLLKEKGKLYICLPDINANRSPYWKNYTDAVYVQPSYGHRMFYSLMSLKYVVLEAELKIFPLSYHDKTGKRIVEKNNLIYIRELDISNYLFNEIEKDMGYSLCVVAMK